MKNTKFSTWQHSSVNYDPSFVIPSIYYRSLTLNGVAVYSIHVHEIDCVKTLKFIAFEMIVKW